MEFKYDVYIGAGWWNEEMRSAKQKIIQVCEKLELSYYDPEDDEFNQLPRPRNKSQMLQCYDNDLEAVRNSRIMIASTVQMDGGTLLEMGYALALGKTIIEYNDYEPDIKGCRNLMLVGACAGKYAQNEEDLERLLRGEIDSTSYDDNIKDVDIL